jgi:hypothetical protein
MNIDRYLQIFSKHSKRCLLKGAVGSNYRSKIKEMSFAGLAQGRIKQNSGLYLRLLVAQCRVKQRSPQLPTPEGHLGYL